MMLQGLSHKSRIKSLATSLSSNSKFLSVNFCISEHLPSENSPIQCLGSKILFVGSRYRGCVIVSDYGRNLGGKDTFS